ncbi:MAG: anaphase promoting complex subunit doc1 [Piccolia ochrophora]|nr:MAG: anaphase promoting complex subunit doc1 [Piccolia ochrophora]
MPRVARPARISVPAHSPPAITPEPPTAPSADELSGGDAEEEMEDVGASEDEDDEEEGSPETEKIEPYDVSHLREIGNLASWTVSTAKPGCGVEALRDEDTNLFWQSDGPQPHLLNIHFTRLVSIAHIRLYLDFSADESYTPTRLSLLAGTSHHDLLEFVELAFEQPKGWIDVDLSGVGGGNAGDTLRAHLLQVRVAENHQNGKDTHVRGLQVFAKGEGVGLRGREREGKGGLEDGGVEVDERFGRRGRRLAREERVEDWDWGPELELR